MTIRGKSTAWEHAKNEVTFMLAHPPSLFWSKTFGSASTVAFVGWIWLLLPLRKVCQKLRAYNYTIPKTKINQNKNPKPKTLQFVPEKNLLF